MTTIHRTGRRPVSAFAFAAATVALFGLAPQAAQAGSILGSGAILTSRPCPAAADQICVVNNVPRTFTQFAGGYGGGLSTFADISAGETAQASVSFGADYLPTVGVGTTAGAATRTGATATAFRSFVYTGDVAIDLALRGDLHYVTSGDALVGDGAGEGTLNVALGLYSLADFVSLSGFGPESDGVDIVSSIVDFPDCEAGASAAGGFNSLGSTGENRATVGLATS